MQFKFLCDWCGRPTIEGDDWMEVIDAASLYRRVMFGLQDAFCRLSEKSGKPIFYSRASRRKIGFEKALKEQIDRRSQEFLDGVKEMHSVIVDADQNEWALINIRCAIEAYIECNNKSLDIFDYNY